MTNKELVRALRNDHPDHLTAAAADAIEALMELVEQAFGEGFAEGYGGGWIEGDYSHSWERSNAKKAVEA